MDELKLYIHGRLVDATSNETFDNINPATGEAIARVQVASKSDVDSAVESAREGFAAWSRMTSVQRGRKCRGRQRGGAVLMGITERPLLPSLPGLTRQSKFATERHGETWITGSRRCASAR